MLPCARGMYLDAEEASRVVAFDTAGLLRDQKIRTI